MDPTITTTAAAQTENDPTWGFSRCMACRRPLYLRNLFVADGCPCNAPRGINHGSVPTFVCTCRTCDPEQTGGTRKTFALTSADLVNLGK